MLFLCSFHRGITVYLGSQQPHSSIPEVTNSIFESPRMFLDRLLWFQTLKIKCNENHICVYLFMVILDPVMGRNWPVSRQLIITAEALKPKELVFEGFFVFLSRLSLIFLWTSEAVGGAWFYRVCEVLLWFHCRCMCVVWCSVDFGTAVRATAVDCGGVQIRGGVVEIHLLTLSPCLLPLLLLITASSSLCSSQSPEQRVRY